MTKIKIDKQRPFSNDYDKNSICLVRVYNKNLKKLGGRHSWVKLTAGTKCIYRTVKAAKPMKGFNMSTIELDYDSLLELEMVSSKKLPDEDGFYPCKITLTPTNKLDALKAYWNHTEHGYRISLRISIVSLFLGLISLLGMLF